MPASTSEPQSIPPEAIRSERGKSAHFVKSRAHLAAAEHVVPWIRVHRFVGLRAAGQSHTDAEDDIANEDKRLGSTHGCGFVRGRFLEMPAGNRSALIRSTEFFAVVNPHNALDKLGALSQRYEFGGRPSGQHAEGEQ